MLTIWNRLKDTAGEIRGPEWMLLTIELVGIVGGILVAFELEQWSSDRRERRAETELLERLLAEAEQTVQGLVAERDGFQQLQEAQVAAMDEWVNGSGCVTYDQYFDLTTVNFHPALPYPHVAYDEMVGSGGLGRLRDPDVRQAIGNFHSEVASFNRQQDYARVSRRREAETPLVLLGDPSFNPETGGFNFEPLDMNALCSDRELQSDILLAMRGFRQMQNSRRLLAQDAIVMCGRIADAIGRECLPGGEALTGNDLALLESIDDGAE
jgi:hypothetical protein